MYQFKNNFDINKLEYIITDLISSKNINDLKSKIENILCNIKILNHSSIYFTENSENINIFFSERIDQKDYLLKENEFVGDIIDDIILFREGFFVSDIDKASKDISFFKDFNINSFIVLPIINNNCVKGIFGLFSSEKDIFSDDWKNLFRFVGNLIYVIYQNLEFIEFIKNQRNRMYNIIKGTKTGTWEWNIQTGEVVINDRWADIVGYTQKELEPISIKTWEELCHPEDLKKSSKLIKRYIDDEIDYYECEARMKHKSGSWVWVVDRGSIIVRDKDGLPVVMMGTHMDITKKKEDELELRNLRNYLKNILNSMSSILIAVDSESCITHWNKVAEQSLEFPDKKISGRKLFDILYFQNTDEIKIKNAIRNGNTLEIVRNPRIKGKEVLYEDITVFPLIGENIKGAVIRIDDVTKRVNLEELIIQSEKLSSLGGLAAGMAHEINNPLAGLIQTAEVIVRRLSDLSVAANIKVADELGLDLNKVVTYMEKRDIPRMIKNVRSSGLRITEIVNDMLSFSEKNDVNSFSSQDPGELMDKTLLLARSDYDLINKYGFKEIKINKKYEPHLPMICCEKIKLQQVLLNILKNGAQAMSENNSDKGKYFDIVISHEKENNMICFEIIDNGPGMDAETSKQVFDPFFTTKKAGRGTGLGLFVSYSIIKESHKGTIEVETAPGSGCKFIISVPVHSK